MGNSCSVFRVHPPFPLGDSSKTSPQPSVLLGHTPLPPWLKVPYIFPAASNVTLTGEDPELLSVKPYNTFSVCAAVVVAVISMVSAKPHNIAINPPDSFLLRIGILLVGHNEQPT